MQTPSFGGQGGGAFTTSTCYPADVKWVTVRCGSRLDNIQFMVVGMPFTQQVQNLEARGGSGGGAQVWYPPNGEYITDIDIWAGARVDAVTFITNKGNRSPKFGGGGGQLNRITIPDGCRICGYYGRAGSEIDQLGFIYREWKQ